MSYEIVYDKQFIKVNDNGTEKYVAMILAGASNCYETNWKGIERRERNWFAWRSNTPLVSTVAEMVAYWDEARTRIKTENEAETKDRWHTPYNDEAYGYWVSVAVGSKHTTKTSYKTLTGVFITGARKSLTIEQLASEGVKVIVKSSWVSSSRQQEIGIAPYSLVVENDSELLGAIAQCEARFKGTGVKATVEFLGMHDEKPKRLRARFFPTKKRVKVAKTFDKSYRIAVNNVGYFVKETSRNMVYNMTGKVFVSKARAMKKLEQLNRKRYSCTFKLVESNTPIEVMV